MAIQTYLEFKFLAIWNKKVQRKFFILLPYKRVRRVISMWLKILIVVYFLDPGKVFHLKKVKNCL